MVTLVTRAGKGSSLTNTEMDANLTNLNTGKAESGRQALYIPAGAMVARTSNGATPALSEIGTAAAVLSSLDFVFNLVKYAQFRIKLPKQWNSGVVRFRAFWSHPGSAGSYGVALSLRGMAVGDAQAMDSAWGTSQTVTDTGGTPNTEYVTGESGDITVSNAGLDKEIIFEVAREVANASDVMSDTLRLHGIELFITTDKVNDS